LGRSPSTEDVERFFKEKGGTHLLINFVPLTDPQRGLEASSRDARPVFWTKKHKAFSGRETSACSG
ncbi:MAG: hypothetical protein MUP19_01965, partial [Candidatus Aminicenantes bacterium]|nr:hypothetical protein [Candidatus Aminicenantes bacterium]